MVNVNEAMRPMRLMKQMHQLPLPFYISFRHLRRTLRTQSEAHQESSDITISLLLRESEAIGK
jgi:hypothetical protein